MQTARSSNHSGAHSGALAGKTALPPAFRRPNSASATGAVPMVSNPIQAAACLASRLVAPQQKLNVTSTIGIRGIEKEDLEKAKFDEQQVKLLERYRATDAQAKAMAASQGLSASTVKYLD